ncbi:UNVERIFIED_CONTAM: Homeobox-leucine zipper protein REVOLUTA [Sesamum angustifolium]|uniref:Homeobox-leucine zipper protein REVOLUTA n=1 Tax=Sesamum angustifolium TaxID=2727405 RepID=A0AAW2QPM2_9LAMI
MAMVVQQHRESSSGSISKHLDAGKYVRYTAEQVEALERVYAECPKPSSLRRQQLIRECPILSNIEPKQIKVWFQNRRCREKQRKESTRLQSVNRKLTAMNKLLMEENDRPEAGVAAGMREWASAPTNDASCESAVTTPHHPLRDANNPAGLLSIAEETLAEFLSKATGTAVDWVQMPGMKPGPGSVGIFAISQSCSGVAARACGLVSLEPSKIAEILKDRPSWFRDCRSLEVFTMFPAGNGGTIELLYTQTYAPTTLAPARDFWTLRYTTTLENGSLVVCERSLSGTGAGPNAAAASQFVRAEMLPSGYLIRPCEGGGSIIHIVDHLNLEAWSVPEVLRPLYESSKVVAQKTTIAALKYIRQIAQEMSGEVVYGLGRQPAVLRTFSQRLSRGFNDAINGFNDDGWSILDCDGAEDVVVAINSAKNLNASSNTLSVLGGVLCAKASMLIQNVPPAVLVRFLREHRSEWADFNVDAYAAAALKNTYAYPGMRPTRFTGSQIIMPLGHTIEHEEMLEVIRLEGHSLSHEDAFMSRDIHLLQMCSGVDENAVGACSELVFAPIDEMFPDDAQLLPSGFRLIPLDSKPGDLQDSLTSHKTLDLTSSLEVGPATSNNRENAAASCSARSILTIAFQFPLENNLQENVATMARQYVRSVISSVQRVAMAISPSGLSPTVGSKLSPASPEALTLAHWICQSYSYHTGAELLRSDASSSEAVLKTLWHHQDAVLCCSLKDVPFFTFANQAGLDMLETTLVALQDITLEKIFDDAGRKALFSEFAKIMQQGFTHLPGGICMSTMGRHISYEQAIVWKVFAGEEATVHCLAFSFLNWVYGSVQLPSLLLSAVRYTRSVSVYARRDDMFWKLTALSASSPVEAVLDKETFTLEELLDEEEIIQECKALNSRLINFLRDRAQVEQLLHYIIDEPPEDADSKRTFKFPFVACEIFTCEIDVILKTLVEEEELMDLLFSFLEPNCHHGALLAGYFSKVVICLMLRKTIPLMNYVKAHQDVFKQLVDLIGITSIMEVLVRLVGSDDHLYPNSLDVMQWLADSNLLEMIVDKLNTMNPPEVHANAAETLCAITRNAPSPLATKLSSPSFVERVLGHALEDSHSKSALVHSLSVCISLLDPKRSIPSSVMYSFRSQHAYEPPLHVNPDTVGAMLPKLGELLMLLNVSSDEKILPTTYDCGIPFGAAKNWQRGGREGTGWLWTIHRVLDLLLSTLANAVFGDLIFLVQIVNLIGKILLADKCPALSGELNLPTLPASGRHAPRAGYLGHLTRISNKIVVQWETMITLSKHIFSRPTALQDRTKDSDEEDVHDRDYDVAALANNLSKHLDIAYMIMMMLRVMALLVVMMSSLFTNSNWFAFQDDMVGGSAPMDTSAPDPLDDLKLNGTSNGGNSSSDDEVVVEEDEELNANRTSTNGSSSSEANPFNGFNTNDSINGVDSNAQNEKTAASNDSGFFRFETTDNDDPFGDRPIPEWVAWGEAAEFQVGGSSVNPFDDQSNSTDNRVHSVEASSVPISISSSADSIPNGTSSSPNSSDGSAKSDSSHKSVVVPSLFEEDVEFVGVELGGTEKAMEQALKEGIVGEAGPLKRNIIPKKPEKEDSDDGGAGMKEFNDANYWRVDQEVAVLE